MLAEDNLAKLWIFSLIEMWHRIMAIIVVLTCSQVDHSRALIVPYTLKENTFNFDLKKNSLVTMNDVTLKNRIHDTLNNVDKNSHSLISKNIHVKVYIDNAAIQVSRNLPQHFVRKVLGYPLVKPILPRRILVPSSAICCLSN